MAQSTAFRAIAGSQFARDPAVTQTTVTLDTSKWSTRKKNIVLESIATGVAACGWQTGHLVREMLNALGSDAQQIAKWSNTISTSMIKEDMLEDLIAYTCAWIKLSEVSNEHRYYGYHWHERAFVDAVDKGQTPSSIPMPRELTDSEKRQFAVKYIKDPSETDRIAREHLTAKIKNGETIELKFAA